MITTDEFLQRYDKKDKFEEDELSDFFWGDFEDLINVSLVEEEDDENRRWSYMNYKYYKIQDRYFMFGADIGLTELQENNYDFYPEEMDLKQETKTIIINVWERKSNE